MSLLADANQKLKGKTQQIQGVYYQQTGRVLKGAALKLKGKINEAVADAKLKTKV